jgi:hypothetical protein
MRRVWPLLAFLLFFAAIAWAFARLVELCPPTP